MERWLLLPFIAAGIGWFTNFLAVRMIFRPQRPIRFLGLTIQGLLPKRHKEFAHSIGTTVQAHLLSADDIKQVLDKPETKESFRKVLEEKLDHYFAKTLRTQVPMLGPFLQGPMVDKIKGSLANEMNNMLSQGAGILGDSLDQALDLKQIVEQKILEFDLHKLEQIVLEIARNELRWIEVLGAILGFLIGTLQVALLHFA